MSQQPNEEQIAYLRQRGSLKRDRDEEQKHNHNEQSETSTLDSIEDKFYILIDIGK